MKYVLHNLIQIDIDDSLMGIIGRSLDFQIGYFKKNEDTKIYNLETNINIKPYDRFFTKIQSFIDISEFHLSKGVKGICLYNETKRLAIIKTKNGFDIYADGPNFLINLYIQLLLYKQGYTMVHAGGYANNDGVTLIAGPGGVGKTALLGYMVNKFNCKTLGDDIIIIKNNGICLSFPRAFVFKEYHRQVYPDLFKELKISKWSTYGIKRFIIENIPFTGLIKSCLRKLGKYHAVAEGLGMDPYLATVPVEKIFGNDTVLDQGKIKRIIFIERYNGREFICEPIDCVSMVNRLFSIIHHEWKSVLGELFELGSLEIINLAKYFHKVEQNIKEFTQHCELKIVRIPNAASPDELASYFEQQELTR